MAQAKPLFVPWLLEQIQSGKFPGVCWTNAELAQFSIPWKHALRQDSNSHDVLIFKAWAQTSAAGDGRINGDSSVWKRNFRSALRAKGFKMIIDNKNDAANPRKVYQFPDSTAPESESSQETEYSPEQNAKEINLFSAAQPPQALERDFIELNLEDSPSQVHEVWNPDELHVGLEEHMLFQDTNLCPDSQLYDIHYPVMGAHELFSAEGAVGGLGQISPTEGAMAVNHSSPVYQTAVQTDGGGVADHTTVLEPTLETFFRIKVYYKGTMVLEQLVENGAGFRLTYQENMEEAAMDSAGLTVVKLPPPDGILDQNQVRLTDNILQNLGGLEVRRLDGVVFGQRWGCSRIFWGLSKHEKSPAPRDLAKNTPQPIYLIKDYISGLIEFMKKGGESPPFSLYFVLGEKWPDPKMKPWEKKLIMVEVILTALEALWLLAVARGASSLQSEDLQISLEQMMEMC